MFTLKGFLRIFSEASHECQAWLWFGEVTVVAISPGLGDKSGTLRFCIVFLRCHARGPQKNNRVYTFWNLQASKSEVEFRCVFVTSQTFKTKSVYLGIEAFVYRRSKRWGSGRCRLGEMIARVIPDRKTQYFSYIPVSDYFGVPFKKYYENLS